MIHGYMTPSREGDVLRAAANVHRERGGILLGFHMSTGPDESPNETVTLLIEAVELKNISKTPEWHYMYDDAIAQESLDQMIEFYREPAGFIGKWHTHPSDTGFSANDIESALRESEGCTTPFLDLVVRSSGRIDWAVYRDGRPLRTEGPVSPTLWADAHTEMYRVLT